VLTQRQSQLRECIQVHPETVLRFRNSRLNSDAEAHERYPAAIEFYRSCLKGEVDYASNPLLTWMDRRYPNGWHGASTAEARIELCQRFHRLFTGIREEGVRQPVRLLEPSLFGRSKWFSFHDGGNRMAIAIVLGLESIPCLVHPRHHRAVRRVPGLLSGCPGKK